MGSGHFCVTWTAGMGTCAQAGIPFMEALRKYSYFGIRPAAWSVDDTANGTYPIELRVS